MENLQVWDNTYEIIKVLLKSMKMTIDHNAVRIMISIFRHAILVSLEVIKC